MTVEKFLSEPYVVNILSGLTVHLICLIGSEFNRKLRKKNLYLELDPLIEGLNFNEKDIEIICEFVQSDKVQKYFYTFISYRTVKFDEDKEPTTRKISTLDFVEKLSEVLFDYSIKNYNHSIEKCKIRNYISEIMAKIESKIIDNMKGNQLYLYNCLTNIELKLEDIRVLNSLLINQRLIKDQKCDFSKYVRAIKRLHNATHVYGIDHIALDKFYIFPNLSIFTKDDTFNKKSLESWKDIFKHSNIVSIIGGPGYGKTTFVKSLIQNYEKLSVFKAEKLIPIYCDLKNFYSFNNNRSNYSMIEFLHDSMINQTGISSSDITLDGLNLELEEGNCIVFFDALDEVARDKREIIQSKVVAFFQEVNPNNKVIITSRSRGFIPHTEFVIEIEKLDSDQTREYLTKVSNLKNCNFSKKDIKPFLQQSNQLINNSFLTSFLLLSLLVSVYKSEQELPATKQLLYKKCVDHIVRQRERIGNKSKYNFSTIGYILNREYTFEELALLGFPNNQNVKEEKVLEHLSKKYKSKYGSTIDAYNAVDEFLKFCADRTDLYVKGSIDNTYKYYHRSLYDYYLSKRLLNKYSDNSMLFEQIAKISSESEVFDLIIEILFNEHYDRYLDFVNWLINNFAENYEHYLSKDNASIKVLTLLLKNTTEVDFSKRYYSLIKKSILAVRVGLDLGLDITHFINVNKYEDNFIAYLKDNEPVKLYSSVLIDIAWKAMSLNNESIFQWISYRLIDSYFEYVYRYSRSIGKPTNIPSFEELINNLIEVDKKVENIIEWLEIIYKSIISEKERNRCIDCTKIASGVSKKMKLHEVLQEHLVNKSII